jgi:hypothetical protein
MGRQRWEDPKFRVSLSYIGSWCLKNKKERRRRRRRRRRRERRGHCGLHIPYGECWGVALVICSDLQAYNEVFRDGPKAKREIQPTLHGPFATQPNGSLTQCFF